MPPTESAAKWAIAPRDPDSERVLQRELGVTSLTAVVLVRRGITDPAAAERFLHPKLDQLHDPKLLPDFDAALHAILHARDAKQTVFVHGDYDVDGISSAALLTRFLQKIGCKVIPHVPHRMSEGYGIHIDAVKAASESGAKLFLTCDCGVSAVEQLAAARESGMATVVTDHHEVGATLPEANAIVNPKRADSQYPFPYLSGAGVALKLCAGITRAIGHKVDFFYRAYLDLAVLGTVADVVPLLGENRVIASLGLPHLAHTNKKGLQALLRVAELAGPDAPPLNARHIGFQIGPRINAIGRLDDAGIALKLFLESDPKQAKEMAELLNRTNVERREEQDAVLRQALLQVEERHLTDQHVIVVAGKDWHPGLIGLVAGKLCERYNRPAIAIGIDPHGQGRGSARSIKGFHMADAIKRRQDLIQGGGGHELAAGFSIDALNVRRFQSAMESDAKAMLTEDDLQPTIQVDAELKAEEAGPEVGAELASLQPYGEENPEPIFVCRDLKLVSVRPTRKPEHVSVALQGAGGPVHQAMGFHLGERLAALQPGTPLDVVFTANEDGYNGRRQFRWFLKDFRVTS